MADAFVMNEVHDDVCPDALEITIDVEMTKRVWQLFEELHRASVAKRAIAAFHEWLLHVRCALSILHVDSLSFCSSQYVCEMRRHRANCSAIARIHSMCSLWCCTQYNCPIRILSPK